MRKWYVFKAVKVLILVVLGITLLGFVIMTFWNNLIPELFHGPHISFIQALGLLILSRLLIGRGSFGCGRRDWGRSSYWKKQMETKLSGMSPEEREKFRQKFYERCGGRYWDKPADTPSEHPNP